MPRGKKKRFLRRRTEKSPLQDRLSDLPNNVLDGILTRLPLRDAVRTTVLSTKWRNVWTSISDLVFDIKFYVAVDASREDLMTSAEYNSIISTVLFFHEGPIQKFDLYVPDFSPDPPLNTSPWILHLSRSGVKDLFFHGPVSAALTIKLPSYIFHCDELRHLKLAYCTAAPPTSFKGFPNLISLMLVSSRISVDALATIVSNCPLLEILSIVNCLGYGCGMEINAPSLRVLFVKSNHRRYVESIYAPCLTTLALDKLAPSSNLIEFFQQLMPIESITFSYFVIQSLATDDLPMTLPITLQKLKFITVFDVSFDSPNGMSCIFCIIRSSPNMQTLNLLISPSIGNDCKVVLDFIEAQRGYGTNFSIRTMQIRCLHGLQVEIELIKALVSCCPFLETLYLEATSKIKFDALSKMAKELKQFTRATTKAEMIFSKSSGSCLIGCCFFEMPYS